MAIDYKRLLEKYMMRVAKFEGVTFVDDETEGKETYADEAVERAHGFTDEEWEELQKMQAQLFQ